MLAASIPDVTMGGLDKNFRWVVKSSTITEAPENRRRWQYIWVAKAPGLLER